MPAIFAQATRCHEQGQWHEAERLYRVVLNAQPNHAHALHQFGLLAYQNGRNDVAIDLVGRALVQAPQEAAFHNTMGGVFMAMEKASDAAASFERALGLDPESIETKNNLANARHAQGRLSEAISIYKAILDAAPNDADVNNNLGYALQQEGRLDEAIQYFWAAKAARPDDALILSHLGNALCAKSMHEEAAEECRQAVALDPGSPIALTNFGNALLGLKRFEEAIDVYVRAIAAEPNIAEIHKNLGIAYHGVGKRKEASDCFKKALTINPDDDVRAALGETYYSLGKLEEAVQAYRSVLEAKPNDRDILLALGLTLNDLGRHSEGLDAIAKGPGLARLTTDNGTKSADTHLRRVSLATHDAPNFIGCWFLKNRGICEELTGLFEGNAAHHVPGRTSLGVDLSAKKAMDYVVFPNDLKNSGNEPVLAYLRELEACYQDYARQWPHFGEMTTAVDLVPFQIQRYETGGHFQLPHNERAAFGFAHRVLAWMTYLNDVEEGGETRFHHFGLDIKPERGKTLIWPVEWTHVHAGQVVKAGPKYVITGWMHFPHPSATHRSVSVNQD